MQEPPEFVIAIPARLQSGRLMKKLVQPLSASDTVLSRVVRICRECGGPLVLLQDDLQLCESVYRVVSRDDVETCHIADACCGTHRVQKWLLDLEPHRRPKFVVNVQADEVFLDPTVLARLIEYCRNQQEPAIATVAATRCSLCVSGCTRVVCRPYKGNRQQAIYFSRLPLRGSLHHVGIYCYPTVVLERLETMSYLSGLESLEQMAWIEAGYRVEVLEVPWAPPAVNTLEEYQLARELIERQGQVAHDAAMLGYCSWSTVSEDDVRYVKDRRH